MMTTTSLQMADDVIYWQIMDEHRSAVDNEILIIQSDPQVSRSEFWRPWREWKDGHPIWRSTGYTILK